MLQLVIPMAGRGSRFAAYSAPKPLIELEPGRPLISYIIDFLTLDEPHGTVFVARADHERRFNISSRLAGLAPGAQIVLLDHDTRGPADSALAAMHLIDDDDEIVIAYCDAFLSVDFGEFLTAARMRSADGSMLLCPSSVPTESYAVIEPDGRVLRTAEKEVISPFATAGFYYFRRSKDFVRAARAALSNVAPEGPEIFVCPLYNDLISVGGLVLSFPASREERYDAGTPDNLMDVRRRLAKGQAVQRQ